MIMRLYHQLNSDALTAMNKAIQKIFVPGVEIYRVWT
jgi:hypothetical protein